MAELRRWRMPPLETQGVGKGIEDPPGCAGFKNVGGERRKERVRRRESDEGRKTCVALTVGAAKPGTEQQRGEGSAKGNVQEKTTTPDAVLKQRVRAETSMLGFRLGTRHLPWARERGASRSNRATDA